VGKNLLFSLLFFLLFFSFGILHAQKKSTKTTTDKYVKPVTKKNSKATTDKSIKTLIKKPAIEKYKGKEIAKTKTKNKKGVKEKAIPKEEPRTKEPDEELNGLDSKGTFRHTNEDPPKIRDSTLYNLMHYKLPDTTKLFFHEMMHPEDRDSIYFKETDIVDLFIYTFSSKNPVKPVKPKKKKRVFVSFFPTGNPVAKNAIVTATNAAFYLGPVKTTKLSNYNFLVFYNWFNQFTFPMRGNIWTSGNKYNLQGDYRFYHYPLATYGIGADSRNQARDLVTYDYIRFHQNILRKVNDHIFLGAGFSWDYHTGIHDNNPDTQGGRDFRAYGEGTSGTSISSGITFDALYDDRANSINPQRGNYLNAVFRVNGKVFGSDNNWQSVYLDARKYISFSKKKNQILCFWALAWFTVSGKPPYLDLPSTAWDVYSSTARGYSQGRYTGKNMIYFETEYRFNLMRNGLIGAVVFVNASAFPKSILDVNLRILPAAGAGLRIKINRDSRTNFAVDYAHGVEGSWGFWVTIGEVF
jgi:hypothetical protein